MAFFGLPCCLSAQQASCPAASVTRAVIAAPGELPDAPTPQIELAFVVDPQAGQSQNAQQPAAGSAQPQNPAGLSSSSQQPAPAPDPAAPDPGGALKNGAASSSSSQQNSVLQSGAQQTQHDEAAQQIKEQEKQRVVGVVPQFNTTYHWNAASMSPSQKMGLALRSMTDPFQFAAAFLVAGYHEALDEDTGFGWGVEGLGKRAGAAYLDAFDGAIIGNGIYPILFRQDPRYFRMGHGTVGHRILYSLATNVIAKHDNTGRWEPNYSNVLGNITSGAISNLYYPSKNTGVGLAISNGFIVTAEGGLGSLFEEFWPDVSRKLLHRDPTHGLDAQQAAEENSKRNQDTGAGAASDIEKPIQK